MNHRIIRRSGITMAITALICTLLLLACKKSAVKKPMNVGAVRFESTSYTIENNSPDSLTVVLPFSLPIEEDASITITIDNSSTINSDEYAISPAPSSNKLVLQLAKGSMETSLKVISKNNFEGDKLLVLKITEATGGLSISNANNTASITIKGEPIVLPEINVSLNTISFGNVAAGSTSEPRTYDVWGVKLTQDVTVTASSNFEISLDGNDYSNTLTLSASALNIAPMTVYVRFIANTGTNQSIDGFITHSSAGVQDAMISTNGIEYGNALPGILIHSDNFDYGPTAGLLKEVTDKWPVFSGTLNPIKYIVPGLSYPGYIGSGIGGAVVTENGSGSREDNSTAFTPQNSGTIYVAQMINIASAASGDFFTSFRDPGGSYFNRIYVRDNGGKPQIGIGKSTATVAYSSKSYEYGQTYLLVHKYDFTTGVSSMYVLSGEIPLIEPATPDAVTSTGSGPTSLVNICLRQNTTLLTATFDGLRIATGWREAVGK